MITRISKRNKFPSFDIEKEFKKINSLFSSNEVFGIISIRGKNPISMSYWSLFEKIFLKWPLRGSFTTLSECVDELGVSEKCFKKDPSEDRLLDYIQFIINAISFVDCFVKVNDRHFYSGSYTIKKAITDNINLLAERFNVEFITENNEIFVSYKNDISLVISNNFPQLRESIVEYQKIDNRDDIKRKGELLCTFSKTLEPYEKKFKGTCFNSLCSDTTMLMNNSGVRHCIDQNNKIGAKFNSMSVDEILKWYDRTFEMFIACMAVVPYLEYKDELNSIKKC